jgi:hypothetical protein
MIGDDYSNDPREAIMNAWDGEREAPQILKGAMNNKTEIDLLCALIDHLTDIDRMSQEERVQTLLDWGIMNGADAVEVVRRNFPDVNEKDI